MRATGWLGTLDFVRISRSLFASYLFQMDMYHTILRMLSIVIVERIICKQYAK